MPDGTEFRREWIWAPYGSEIIIVANSTDRSSQQYEGDKAHCELCRSNVPHSVKRCEKEVLAYAARKRKEYLAGVRF
jgi:hypothetical protein